MDNFKENLISSLEAMKRENHALFPSGDVVSVTDFSGLVRNENGYEIWTDAFRAALSKKGNILIPPRAEPYYIDDTLIVSSDTHIGADGATIKLTPDCEVLMLRSDNTSDGTRMPIIGHERTKNVSINGGKWEESREKRCGYGITGRYDRDAAMRKTRFHGVSALFFFNNINHLTIENATFAHTSGFAVQLGDATDAFFEHIRFESCYADGLHINGNTDRVLCRDVKGQVGDDLVALNAYDWQNSSVDFGPIENVFCEDLELSEDSHYKAIRIQPGRYYFDDGSDVDCAIRGMIMKKVRGIKTFKLYFQTPPYKLGNPPERGGVGSADNLYFDDIEVDLTEPADVFGGYKDSDPVRGSFGAFEFGSEIGRLSFENIDLKLHRDRWPYSYLAVVGPKSVMSGGVEIFDPYISSSVGELLLSDIRVNGEKITDAGELLREVVFDDIDGDGHSTGRGKIEKIIIK